VPTPTYFAIFTTLGLTRLSEAQASGVALAFAHVAVGDGGGNPIAPDASMTALVNERARVVTNSVSVSPDALNVVRVEGLIPSSVGGFTIREAGVFNRDGELLAIASYPPIYKPITADGVTVEEYIRILLQYATTSAIAVSTDPNVVTATQRYVDDNTAGAAALWETYS
jgi:phage-related tail fiber protein